MPLRSSFGQSSICASIRMFILALSLSLSFGFEVLSVYVVRSAAPIRAGSAGLARQKAKHDAEFGTLDELKPKPGLCDALLGFA